MRSIPLSLAACGLSFTIFAFPALAQDGDPDAEARNASWAAYQRGDFGTARSLAEEILARNPDDVWSVLLIGKILEDQGDWGDEYLLRAEELAGDDVAVLSTLADTWAVRYSQLAYTDNTSAAAESRAKAEALYLRWSKLDPASATPIQGLAWLKRYDGDKEGEIGYLLAAISKDPNALGPLQDIWRYLGADVPHDRLVSFYEGLALGAHDATTRARCRQYGGQVLAAKAEERKAASSEAAAAGDKAGKVNALHEAKDYYLRAIDAMEAAASIDEGFRARADWDIAHYQVGIADVYRQLGDLPALLHHVENARPMIAAMVRAYPEEQQPKADLDMLSFYVFDVVGGESGAFTNPERWAKAMNALADYWQWATTVDPNNATWWNNAGFFARESGRYEESYAAYRRCVELDPTNVRSLNDTALILLYHLHRDYDEAERLLQQAFALGAEQYPRVKNSPTQEPAMRSAWGDAMLNLGLLYLETGRLDEAEAALENLAEFDGERADLKRLQEQLEVARLVQSKDRAAIEKRLERALLAIDPPPRNPRAFLADLRYELERHRSELPFAGELLERIDRALSELSEREKSGGDAAAGDEEESGGGASG